MRKAAWRQSPAIGIAFAALFVALGGTVYAAKKLDGRAIRVKSIPGNRLKPRSVPANRLKPGVLKRAATPTGPLTGADIDERTLGPVPLASHAETADNAQSARDAETSLNAVNALNAQAVNGFEAGCLPGTQLFAGACWDASSSDPDTAPAAAVTCATRGGSLPEPLLLAAFAEEPGIGLAEGGEWTSDITNVSGDDAYGVITVSDSGVISFSPSATTKRFRCVFPLLK